jgi:hypothetical protein
MGKILHSNPDYVARARALGPALAEVADEIERNRELPASLVSALIDNGLFRRKSGDPVPVGASRRLVCVLRAPFC